LLGKTQKELGLGELKRLLENADLTASQQVAQAEIAVLKKEVSTLRSELKRRDAIVDKELLRLHDLVSQRFEDLKKKFDKKLGGLLR